MTLLTGEGEKELKMVLRLQLQRPIKQIVRGSLVHEISLGYQTLGKYPGLSQCVVPRAPMAAVTFDSRQRFILEKR